MRSFNQTTVLGLVATLFVAAGAFAQPGVFNKDDLIKYTPEWKGERFDDGRPRSPTASSNG